MRARWLRRTSWSSILVVSRIKAFLRQQKRNRQTVGGDLGGSTVGVLAARAMLEEMGALLRPQEKEGAMLEEKKPLRGTAGHRGLAGAAGSGEGRWGGGRAHMASLERAAAAPKRCLAGRVNRVAPSLQLWEGGRTWRPVGRRRVFCCRLFGCGGRTCACKHRKAVF